MTCANGHHDFDFVHIPNKLDIKPASVYCICGALVIVWHLEDGKWVGYVREGVE